MTIAIIGSGIGGLAAAIRLAVKGHKVTVFEKNSYPGGKMSQLKLGAYRFDTGPSLFTLPELVEEIFAITDDDIHKVLPYNKLDINCKYYFHDGKVFNFYHNLPDLRKELVDKTDENPENIFKRLKKSKEVYELTAPVFIFNTFGKLTDFTTPPYKKIALNLQKLDFFRTMHGANKRDFKDNNIIQLFDRYATYNGSNPYKAPATLNIIAHLENNIGAFFPVKGMYSIIEGLYRAANKCQVEFRFNTKVEKILTVNKKAVGVKTPNADEFYDCIISDADAKYVANHLLESHPLQKRLKRTEPSSSALIFYWGINKNFPELELHNILFSGDYKTEFNHLFRKKNIYHDPTIYIFISSKVVKTDAPDGCENWFVMVNAPSDNGQNWEEIISQTRKNIIDKINRTLNTQIEKHIEVEEVGSPVSIEKNTLSSGGALYGASSNSMFSAFLRHPNTLKGFDNLYFVGGSVHPGGGIPLCLASAKIVVDQISEKNG